MQRFKGSADWSYAFLGRHQLSIRRRTHNAQKLSSDFETQLVGSSSASSFGITSNGTTICLRLGTLIRHPSPSIFHTAQQSPPRVAS
ncbi:hypothetical protein DPMN_116324 [Dreissena polymorpha]|uniref:Uncharacterized protein n=1 Tax=Dreissena polymorpha TaxID=45954 RepID=A0A9D4QUM7_DREPO|nr:hypothetical protein DPMN_116324 [Dreissena polymorpha]